MTKVDKFFLLHGIPSKDFYSHLRTSLSLEKGLKVLIPEMRPYLYGSKIVANELLKEHITPTLITDNMMGFFFYKGLIKKVYLFYKKEEPNALLAYPGATLVALLSCHHKVRLHVFKGREGTPEVLLDRDSSTLLGKRILPEGIEALRVEDEVVPWGMIQDARYKIHDIENDK